MKEKPHSEDCIACDVAEIFRLYGGEYRRYIRMPKKYYSVMAAIEGCRTSDYGYHIDLCDKCGNTESQFNSCRDRHCPKCQSISRQKWVNARLEDVLPLPYYHIVFTVPHHLNSITLHNKRLIYDLLLSSSSETLLSFGKDPKWLGGEIGFYGILHTWGQTLWLHPHVHFIVPGGALTEDGRWVEPAYKDKFLFPVKALSRVFRGKFIEGLKNAYYQGKLSVPPELMEISRSDLFEAWLDNLVSQDWVVYCKPPFADAEQVIGYIGRYTHRVAISNQRIMGVKDNRVHFWHKDYRLEKVRWCKMSLKCTEFIRRFLLHVLPQGFHKIRHYGFLANGRCKTKLKQIRALINTASSVKSLCCETFKRKCPECLVGFLYPVKVINRWGDVFRSFAPTTGLGYAFDTS